MPFKSQAQRAYMFQHHPQIAKRFEAETPKGKLPYHASGGGKRLADYMVEASKKGKR